MKINSRESIWNWIDRLISFFTMKYFFELKTQPVTSNAITSIQNVDYKISITIEKHLYCIHSITLESTASRVNPEDEQSDCSIRHRRRVWLAFAFALHNV